jgi:hypothetical protein
LLDAASEPPSVLADFVPPQDDKATSSTRTVRATITAADDKPYHKEASTEVLRMRA